MSRIAAHWIALLALSSGVAEACAEPGGGSVGQSTSAGASGSAQGGGKPQAGQGGQVGAGAEAAANGGAGFGGSAGTPVAGGNAGGSGNGGAGGSQNLPPNFVKVKLDAEFYSEGINAGDIDGDGAVDIVTGPYIFPGPDFVEKRSFREPRATPFDISGDSDCYSIFLYDLNHDGRLDILSTRLAGGAEAVWYENPQSPSAHWVEHVVFSAVDNESATFVDIDGDGKPELVTNSNGYGGWATPDFDNPGQPWVFHGVTAKGSWARYTHGLGVGDINADGRLDLLLPEGWWQQPEASSALPWPAHPAVFWGQELAGEGYGGAQMIAYDVDGDGDNDVVTSLQAHGWGLAWFEQTDAGFVKHLLMNTHQEEAAFGVAFAQLHALELADLDGDGDRDIITGKRKGAHGNGLGAELDAPAVLYWFELLREPGQLPRYTPHLIDSEAGVGTQVVVSDVNDDGRADVLSAARAGAFVFLNR